MRKKALFNKKYRGFTLIEVMLVLGLITVLAGLTFFALSFASRKSRDAQRVNVLNNVKEEILSFQIKTGRVPNPQTQMNWTTNAVIVGYGTPNAKTISLNGATSLRAINTSAVGTLGDSDSTGTIYYYWVMTDGFVLGADKEDGVADVGTSKTTYSSLRP